MNYSCTDRQTDNVITIAFPAFSCGTLISIVFAIHGGKYKYFPEYKHKPIMRYLILFMPTFLFFRIPERYNRIVQCFVLSDGNNLYNKWIYSVS